MPKVRLSWPATTQPPRTLTREEFMAEFGGLSPQSWTQLPAGPVVAERLDAQGRVFWTGHYARGVELSGLLRHLLEERELAERKARAKRAEVRL